MQLSSSIITYCLHWIKVMPQVAERLLRCTAKVLPAVLTSATWTRRCGQQIYEFLMLILSTAVQLSGVITGCLLTIKVSLQVANGYVLSINIMTQNCALAECHRCSATPHLRKSCR